MRQRSARIVSFALAVTLGLTSLAPAADAMDDRLNAQTSFNIPAQALGSSLKQLADQAGIQILFEEQLVSGLKAPAVKTQESPLQALSALLKGTGLEFAAKGQTIAVRKKSTATTSATAEDSQGSAGETDRHYGRGGAADSSLGPLQVAQGEDKSNSSKEPQRAANDKSSPDAASLENKATLDEVLVTAQKRTERLQDVPVPVTVLNADSLVDNNLLQLRDYYSKIPGLSYTPSGVGSPLIVIRGLTSGGSSTTVGMVLDDVSYGASSYYAGGYSSYDIDPSELDRIEVLRGPQGTLYGASSIGGLVKYVTVDPSTERISGRVQAGGSSVASGHDAGYYVRGALNLPLGDTLAFRGSAFARRDPGFIDNVETGQRDANRTDAEGGRLAALWRLSPTVSLKISALRQHTHQSGSAQVDLEPGLGDLQNTNIRGTGGLEHDVAAYSANLNARIGGVDVTAVTGYNSDEFSSPLDLSFPFFNDVSQQYFGVYGTGLQLLHKNHKFTQEIRVSTPIGHYVDWLLGGFHTTEGGGEFNGIYGADPATGAIAGFWDHVASTSEYKEFALFSDLTFHVTDRFDVQVGGRTSHVESSAGQYTYGAVFSTVFGTPDPSIIPQRSTKDNAFTYLVTPQFKFSPDLMVYARLASGYRPGGTNIGLPGTPAKYAADSTQNYEIGAKGNFLDHALSFDASIYYIAWKDLQLSLNDGFSTFFANGGRAKSQGVELSSAWRPLQGLTLSGWVAWNDAKLTQPLPATSNSFGASGERLPYSSRFSGTFSVEQEFPLTGRTVGLVSGSVSYVGERKDNFASTNFATGQPSGPRLSFPAYTRADLQAGVRSGPWSGNLFVNNISNARGIVSGGYDPVNNTSVTFIQPRTVGLSLSRSF